MDDQTIQAIGYTANATATTFSLLVRCLESTGALKEGEFEARLRATIEHPDAARSRLDYLQLQTLLEMLENKIPKPIQ